MPVDKTQKDKTQKDKTQIDATWISNMEEMRKVVMGNGNPKNGLPSVVAKLKKDLNWNTRLTWGIFVILLSTVIRVLVWGL